ncbi:hypothetical protein OUZ56_011620 [Daphnia magna]|uniref:Uncharacterized protein n=1 Tax=Daphnia magna TaxID=35525 RepID=A0ABQ9Z0N7_9CRUS|nr:hypothetical protein OUZ56_011620 [Daphnia magna]
MLHSSSRCFGVLSMRERRKWEKQNQKGQTIASRTTIKQAVQKQNTKPDEEVPREDEQAADDTRWENSKGKALRRTSLPTERLYPHLSEVEENEVVESKSEEELPEVDEEDKNQAELSKPKRKAQIKETKLMEEKDSATEEEDESDSSIDSEEEVKEDNENLTQKRRRTAIQSVK